jgi:hypothetical protein
MHVTLYFVVGLCAVTDRGLRGAGRFGKASLNESCIIPRGLEAFLNFSCALGSSIVNAVPAPTPQGDRYGSGKARKGRYSTSLECVPKDVDNPRQDAEKAPTKVPAKVECFLLEHGNGGVGLSCDRESFRDIPSHRSVESNSVFCGHRLRFCRYSRAPSLSGSGAGWGRATTSVRRRPLNLYDPSCAPKPVPDRRRPSRSHLAEGITPTARWLTTTGC